jgi:hypothetical protein
MRVKAGIFNFTPPAQADEDSDYLRWHLLDHMPEQFQLPGMQHAVRYIADDACRQARIVGEGALAEVGYLMTYLIGDPVEQTVADFRTLGARLADVGRFPRRRRSLQKSALGLTSWHAAPAALVSGEVVAWRPHRGVFLIVDALAPADLFAESADQGFADFLWTPGVAGVWTYRTTDEWNLASVWPEPVQQLTVVYLDAEPMATSQVLEPIVHRRWARGLGYPRFAGPLRTMTTWEAWPE